MAILHSTPVSANKLGYLMMGGNILRKQCSPSVSSFLIGGISSTHSQALKSSSSHFEHKHQSYEPTFQSNGSYDNKNSTLAHTPGLATLPVLCGATRNHHKYPLLQLWQQHDLTAVAPQLEVPPHSSRTRPLPPLERSGKATYIPLSKPLRGLSSTLMENFS